MSNNALLAALWNVAGATAAKRIARHTNAAAERNANLFETLRADDDRVALACEVAARYMAEQAKGRDALTSPQAVRSFLRLRLQPLAYEAFHCAFLDAQNRVIEFREMFRGTLTQTSVYPREVVKAALACNAAGVILSHNHPSGVAEPSIQDQALTRSLSEALALVDCKVLDHFIVAQGGGMSFAERGLL